MNKQQYKINKGMKVGEICRCPACNTKFTKEHYQQTFCKTKGGTVCKDKYWNTIIPTKRNNMSRISPANYEYQYNNKIGIFREEREEIYIEDDPSWDAHKDTM